MPYPLKSNFRKRTPISALRSVWANWVSNFFNTVVFDDGLAVEITPTGKNSTIATVGYSGNTNTYDNPIDLNQINVTFVDGRITAIDSGWVT